jgi:DNA-binding GntR family transcriptional regulator
MTPIPDAPLAPALSMTFAEVVYQRLRDEILNGELRPGDRLAEVEVATRMGTSQAPVREAFTRLREHGLLISFRNRGSYVSEISVEEARDTYAVRLVLEVYATRLALPHMGKPEYTLLEKDIAAMERAAKRDNMAENLMHDMRFHRRIYEWSDSPTLLRFWDSIEVKIRKFAIVASPPVFSDPLRPVASHYALLERMREGDTPELEAEIVRHLEVIWLGTEDAKPVADA